MPDYPFDEWDIDVRELTSYVLPLVDGKLPKEKRYMLIGYFEERYGTHAAFCFEQFLATMNVINTKFPTLVTRPAWFRSDESAAAFRRAVLNYCLKVRGIASS